MVAPERKQKGDGVGEAESVEDLKIHSFHKQWDNYYVPNAKCVAEKPAPSTPAASYCLAGGLRTAAHGRTDGRTDEHTSACSGLAQPRRSGARTHRPRSADGNLGRPRPPAARGSAPRPRPLRCGSGDTWPPRSARFSSVEPGRVVSGLPESPGAF